MMMWNPPATLGIVQVLGIFPYNVSRLIWLIVSVTIIVAVGEMTWKLFGGRAESRWIAWILMLTFGPVIQMLKLGQIVPLMMLGVVGFLFFLKRQNLPVAGLALSLTLVKPHTLYLIWMALLFWSLWERKWLVWIGVAAGVLVPLAVACIVNPLVIQQYLYALETSPPAQWVTATLGSQLRVMFGPEKFWLQFLPSIAGGVMFSGYFFLRRTGWNWLEETPVVLLASVATAAYGWVFDLPVCAVALIALVAQTSGRPKSTLTWVLFGVYVVLSLGLALGGRPQDFYWWAGTVLLVLFLSAIRSMGLSYPGIADPRSR